jgi:hypothetical protein
MVLDHIIAYSNTGRYTAMPGLPVIPHPVIAVPGNYFYCLSTSAAADGTRAADWHLCNFQGVTPVCSCQGFRYHGTCPHLGIVEAQMPALVAHVNALLAADRAARKAARQEGAVAA